MRFCVDRVSSGQPNEVSIGYLWRTLAVSFLALIHGQAALADECGTVSCRKITRPHSVEVVAQVMRDLGTDCQTVSEVRLLDKSNRMMSIYVVKCDDGNGLQQYQITHQPYVGELSVLKATGRWMDTKETTNAPKAHLVPEAAGKTD
jgi:hypothetical protein